MYHLIDTHGDQQCIDEHRWSRCPRHQRLWYVKQAWKTHQIQRKKWNLLPNVTTLSVVLIELPFWWWRCSIELISPFSSSGHTRDSRTFLWSALHFLIDNLFERVGVLLGRLLRDDHWFELFFEHVDLAILAWLGSIDQAFTPIRVHETILETTCVFGAAGVLGCKILFFSHLLAGNLRRNFQSVLMIVALLSTARFIMGLRSTLNLIEIWSIMDAFEDWIFWIGHESCSSKSHRETVV